MNLLPLLLGFVLFKSLNNKEKQRIDLTSLLSNPDVVSMLPHVTKLFDKTSTQEEKNMAMMSLMTNPAVFEIMSKFAPPQNENTNNEQCQKDNQKDCENKPNNNENDCNNQQNDTLNNCESNKNNENKTTNQNAKFSKESRDFFKPVEKVAGVEISQKLYSLYDNWYIKK